MATIFDGGRQRYNSVARTLHWVIAVLIIGNLAGGLLHDALEDVVNVMPIHKATGLLILGLTLVRIGWRLTHRPPPLPGHVAGLERLGAQAAHVGLYALMLLMPMSGWIMSSAGKYPLSFYGLFDVPKFAVTRDDPIAGIAGEGHGLLGWVMLALVVLHVAAALRHHFVLKDQVLRRMA
ncbi:cytochrome B [Sphingomonas spermidinifaciens]|uniref:Cytochrome B n=1 Tax=Sphingomonas spermidinifaciens TaxID=1141889 RepID=A0A2A4B5B3_9SPHN|nr:cytochrome b [Sphingomonas spermidinifaciens]PCD02938.1 cytochrome B [Sphingomonas spermidinifaciens]